MATDTRTPNFAIRDEGLILSFLNALSRKEFGLPMFYRMNRDVERKEKRIHFLSPCPLEIRFENDLRVLSISID
jgi:hypothetical protein